MFKSGEPRLLEKGLAYPGLCADCGKLMERGEFAYFQHKTNSPTGKSRIWHTCCYEQTRGTAGQAQHTEPAGPGKPSSGAEEQGAQGPETQYTPQEAQQTGNSPGEGQGAGEQGGGMEPPKMKDLVCQILYDDEKLARHLHREDVYKVLARGFSPWNASSMSKAQMVEMLARSCRKQADLEEQGIHPYNLLKSDNKLRELLKLPNRPDPSQSPEAMQQQVQQNQEQVENALKEVEEAMKMAEEYEERTKEAEERAEKAEGRIVKIETPEGKTIALTDKHFKFPELAQLVGAGVPVLIVGPAGGGKTEACRSLAEDLETEFMPLSLGPQTTQASLFGYTDAQGNYVRTPFREAFENGGLILLDEFDRCNERVSVTLNAAIAQRYCAFPDGTVHAHDNCVIVAAANTTGHGADRQYVSARQQDAATLDRFAVLDWPYDEQFETKITLAQGLDEDEAYAWLRKVRDVRQTVSELALRYLVSPRASIQGAKLLASGASQELAADAILFRGWKPEDRSKVEDNA